MTLKALTASGVAAAVLCIAAKACRKKKQIREKPQLGFSRILTDNSDTPFSHLCPEAGDDEGPDVVQCALQVEAVLEQKQQQQQQQQQQKHKQNDGDKEKLGDGDGQACQVDVFEEGRKEASNVSGR